MATPCTVEGCPRFADRYPRLGYCEPHALMYWRTGDPLGSTRKPKKPYVPCAVGGCETLQYNRLPYCRNHWAAFRKYGDPLVRMPKGVPKGTPQEGRPPRGGVPGYDAAHRRVARIRGNASELTCVDCGGQAHEWSYSGGDPDELTTRPDLRNEHPGLRYSLNVEFYEPRCVRCHRHKDDSVAALERCRQRAEAARVVALP